MIIVVPEVLLGVANAPLVRPSTPKRAPPNDGALPSVARGQVLLPASAVRFSYCRTIRDFRVTWPGKSANTEGVLSWARLLAFAGVTRFSALFCRRLTPARIGKLCA